MDDQNPICQFDNLGLLTSYFVKKKIRHFQVNTLPDWEFDSPSWSWWGYIKFIQVKSILTANIFVDVKCIDLACNLLWHVIDDAWINVRNAKVKVGPNAYAFVGGLFAGPIVGFGANFLLATGAAYSEYRAITQAYAFQFLDTIGATEICRLNGLPRIWVEFDVETMKWQH